VVGSVVGLDADEVEEVWFVIRGQISRPPASRRQGEFEDARDGISLADAYRDIAALSAADDYHGLSQDDKCLDELSDEGFGSEEDTNAGSGSYGQLLQALNSHPQGRGPAMKKRKLVNASSEFAVDALEMDMPVEQRPQHKLPTDDLNGLVESDESDSESAISELGGRSAVYNQEDEIAEVDLIDPFESHFASPDPQLLRQRLKEIKDRKWTSGSTTTSHGLKQQCSVPAPESGASQDLPLIRAFESLKVKRRLIASGQKAWSSFGATEREVASPVFAYRDVLFGSRTIENGSRLRDLVVLHALNHIFKTRDRVIKNNSKLVLDESGDASELRDQGFTRPKVLFILPTRQACVRFIESMVKLSQPEQQENKSRFMEGFSQDDDNSWEDKPLDFQELFGGNDDDMFRIGLKFTRKTVKFFSAFYNSDVILASPLGLRTAIEAGGSKDSKKVIDADFLSSIEIVVVDHANALLMQNWQHVEYILSHLNLLPKESHGCDFSRVRHWYLDGESKHLRQTIVFTNFITPEINAIYTKSMLNFAGKTRYTPIYKGSMLDVAASLPVNITQTFLRLKTPTPASDADVRFSHFTSSVLPSLLKSKQEKGTLIFTSSYLDFIRLRNHFSSSSTTASLSFGAISEYTSVRDVARARSHLLTGRHSVLLYSERAHHFRRYKLKGVKRLIFYSLPENPIFWSEMVGTLSSEFEDGTDPDRRTVRALFSRWDVLKLERIVGTSRVGKMVNDKAGDTFEFT
jgi:U3 small nucleolar RNA-associated protein 25